MSGSTPIGKFRAKMDGFLADLKSWATPEQGRELEKFTMKYGLGMKANPRGTTEMFLNILLPYGHQIMQGDEDFFLSDQVQADGEYAQLGAQLKAWWPGFSGEQKEHIKKMFKLLFMLATIALQSEEARGIINTYRDPDNPLAW